METFPARRSTDQPGDPGFGKGLAALIVDDETSYRERVAGLARRAGFATDEACEVNGLYALISHAQYDLLLLNLDIPGVDELALITRLRANERTRNTYAVVVTSRMDAERNLAALAAGYDDSLSKSATELEIVARLVAARRLALRQQTFDRLMTELYGLAARDELTGVFNRRFFLFEAEKLLRKGEPLAVVLFDLDGFKRINDTFGHLTGDRVLRDIGALFQRSTRPEDLLARYGGDEFVMAIGGPSMNEAERVAARLVREVESLRWMIGSEELSVGVTVGFASSHSLDDPMLGQLLDIADRDLYNKKRGKGTDRAMPLPASVPEHRV